MTAQTKRWMKRELQLLLAQRERYVVAENASTDVRQKVSHTTQRLRLDEEIQGRQEALAALAQHDEERNTAPRPPRPRRRRRERFVTDPRKAPSIVPLCAGMCAATFALGFVLVDSLMASPRSSTTARPDVQRYQRLAPAAPVRVHKRTAEPVMTAIAPTTRRRR